MKRHAAILLLGPFLSLAGCSDAGTVEPGTGGSSQESGGASGGSGGGGSDPDGSGGDSGDSSTGGSAGGGNLMGGAGSGTAAGQSAPKHLSETGLYQADMETLEEGVHFFEPNYWLWTDTAEKKRWIWLPPDTQIDTVDMDFWEFPAGTKLWKEFSRDGVRVETRLLHKQPNGEWVMMAYQWRSDQSDADAVEAGLENASGTPHDIPSAEACGDCHLKVPDKGIGFSAVQLSHTPSGQDPSEWTLQSLVEQDLLTVPPEGDFMLPGTELEQAALGYLHANCGHCHNRRSAVSGRVPMYTWLTVETLGGPIEETPAYSTMVGKANSLKDEGPAGSDLRINPGNPAESSAYLRMEARGPMYSMPPLGTEDPDADGLAILEDWILSLSAP